MNIIETKKALIADIIQHLNLELENTLEAAKNAHLAATDDQSVAETQYDTLAIEAGYLAHGQSRRAQEIQQTLKDLHTLTLQTFTEETPIAVSAMVQLSQDEIANHWFFIAPSAGGFRGTFEENNFTVITPQSPMGQALVGKYLHDDVEIAIGHGSKAQTLNDYISSCY